MGYEPQKFGFDLRPVSSFQGTAMKSVLYSTQTDPESVCKILAAVRGMANLAGDSHISLRISISEEECARCGRVSEMFIEPAGVCTTCWTILVLNRALASLKDPFLPES